MKLPLFLTFALLITLLLISWSLVTSWIRFVDNIFYVSLGWDPRNTLATAAVAFLLTMIFITLLWIIKLVGLIPDIEKKFLGLEEHRKGEKDVVSGGNSLSFGDSSFSGASSPRGAFGAIDLIPA